MSADHITDHRLPEEINWRKGMSLIPRPYQQREEWMVEWRVAGKWEDAGWTIDDKPMRFATEADANAEIADLFQMLAKTEGMTPPPREDYRAVPVSHRLVAKAPAQASAPIQHDHKSR